MLTMVPSSAQPARSLIGRAAELEQLRRTWRHGGSTVIVTGPAGVGKSRLTRELGSWATGRGGWVLTGRSTAGHATPLRPVGEALIGAARRGARPGPALEAYAPLLGRLVPEWADASAPRGELSTLLLGEAVLRFVADLSSEQPGLVVLEDLHWADPETLEVIEYLADHVEGRPVTVVGTLRGGETGPGTEVVSALVRRRVAGELELGPLGPDSIVELATACLVDEELPDEIVDVLRDRSEGIPFFIEELVAAAASSGWESVAAAVPGSVLRPIELRFEAVDDDLRRLLVAAAVQGRHFDWRVAAASSGLDERSAGALLREAVHAQLVEADHAGFRFRHALTRDAVSALALPAERTTAARAVLETLDGSDGRDVGRCLLAADLATEIGDEARAASVLMRAARIALADGMLEPAERFAERARRHADGECITEVVELLLEICSQSGNVERGRSLAAELLIGVTSSVDDARRADHHLLAGALELAGGHWAAAAEHAAAARALARDDAVRRARSDVLDAQAAMGRDDVDTALSRAREALVAAETTAQPAVQCEAHEVIGRVERGRDLATAEAAFQRAHDVAQSAQLSVWRVRALQELGTVDLFDSLRLDRLEEARRESLRHGALGTAAMVDLQLAATHLERGEVARALETARRCEEVSRRLGLSTEPMSVMVQAMAHARFGDRVAMGRALATGRSFDQDRDYIDASVWGNAVPVLDLVVGDLAAAAAALDRGMDVVRRRPAAALPFPGLWALVCTVLDRDGDAARREVRALPFDTPASRRTLLAADAVAAGRTGARDRAVATFADADRQLGAPAGAFRRWLARLIVAPAAHADGWGDPAAWLREALAAFEQMALETLAGRCRRELRAVGAAVPRRSAVATVQVPPPLAGSGVTGREAQVLVLVAEGATNRDIAERLVVSVRTVDKHVERLLDKTGAGSRTGLREVAQRAGLVGTDSEPRLGT